MISSLNIECRHFAQEKFTIRPADDVNSASRIVFAFDLDLQRYVYGDSAGVPFFGAKSFGHQRRGFSDDKILRGLPEDAQLYERIDGGGAALKHGGVE